LRILLTGATGFLGQQLLPLLRGHDVLCLSLEPHRVGAGEGVRAIAADLRQVGQWKAEIQGFRPECCVHLAWQGLPDYSLDWCRINLDASLRLLEVVSACGVSRVVVAGSCWEYGRARGAVTEQAAPLEPGTFASTKLALLSVLGGFARDAGFDYRWARVFFVYGPNQRKTSLIPALRSAYLAGRTPDVREPGAVQDFVHVDDVAAGFLALVESPGPSGAFNLGSGQPTSVADVANLVADYYGRERPFQMVPPGSGFWADTTKARSSTAWAPRLGIQEGVTRMLATLDAAR
jgi:nucleoside-diphosphate-sugar epimerase